VVDLTCAIPEDVADRSQQEPADDDDAQSGWSSYGLGGGGGEVLAEQVRAGQGGL